MSAPRPADIAAAVIEMVRTLRDPAPAVRHLLAQAFPRTGWSRVESTCRHFVHKLVRPDNGYCSRCGGPWTYRDNGAWNYYDGAHTQTCDAAPIYAALLDRLKDIDDHTPIDRPELRERIEALRVPDTCDHGSGCECGDWASGHGDALDSILELLTKP